MSWKTENLQKQFYDGSNDMESVVSALTKLSENIMERDRRVPITFKQFLELAVLKPDRVFRDIFSQFHDMIHSHVGAGVNEYPDDPESINYLSYDCSSLFENGTEQPFFADRLFANRLISNIATFRQGIQQNRILIFEGPHGCGKSTFLNNLLMKFEEYTKTEEGSSFEIIWRIEKKELGAYTEYQAHNLLTQLRGLVDNSITSTDEKTLVDTISTLSNRNCLEIPCPSHDNPLLIIPREYRREYFDELIPDTSFKEKLFSGKEYEWVFRDNPCTICSSLYQTLLDIYDTPEDVFKTVFARRYQFNRRLGEGVSVFNPGDLLPKSNVLTNEAVQNQLNALLHDSNKVRYTFSRYAKTNSGIYAIMDIKDHNRERFNSLHGIISEGIHKVEDIEENVNSLFLATMNPEDKGNIAEKLSFEDRITYIKIPYVLDFNTEVKIFKNVFGDLVEKKFLPRIIQNFAKVIVSSRLNTRSEVLLDWIGDPEKYSLYCDRNLHLLKMDIYTGHIPSWLTEEDRKNFTAKLRRKIIAESEFEGNKGFSGRDSIKMFNEFCLRNGQNGKPVTMAMVHAFFKRHRSDHMTSVPDGFLDSLLRLYNYTVLQEVKEALYYYNEERISLDIQNYLFAVNFEPGRTERCLFTGEVINISEDFFMDIETRLLGPGLNESRFRSFRMDIQARYASETLSKEIMLDEKPIRETSIFSSLYERYVHNLKERVMDPFLENENFRRAIKDYGTESFKTYDKRIREEVSFLIKNLIGKYGYSEQGAQEVGVYVVDNDLAGIFPPTTP